MMKCPGCGKEMEKGAVQSTRSYYFTKETSKFSSVPNLGTDIRLSGGGVLQTPTCTAFHCKDCKKVVLDCGTLKGTGQNPFRALPGCHFSEGGLENHPCFFFFGFGSGRASYVARTSCAISSLSSALSMRKAGFAPG